MKQTQARTIYQSQSSAWQQLRYFTIGNLLFELDQFNNSNNLSSPNSQSSFTYQEGMNLSEEELYNYTMKLKQQLQPVSCIQSNNQSSQLQATYLQERGSNVDSLDQHELIYEFSMKNSPFSSTLERYFSLRNAHSNDNQYENSDSGMMSNGSQPNQEQKENVFFNFCNQEIAKLNDLNGKQQVFSYTVVQCLDDEFAPNIYKQGFSDSLISILGFSRNNYQQMLMRSGAYLPYHQEIRNRNSFSLLESFLMCHEKMNSGKNFHTYSETCQFETFERLFFNCSINKYVIPCVIGGTLLGFIVLDLYTIPGSVIQGLLSRRKLSNTINLPVAVPEEYKQQAEQFIEKIKRLS